MCMSTLQVILVCREHEGALRERPRASGRRARVGCRASAHAAAASSSSSCFVAGMSRKRR